ncbi:hypothetical protein J6590_032897 [Homalodisca vitripennis]|nr:hypothetical protein J6590_032897 [Homalodisca vitripennis]
MESQIVDLTSNSSSGSQNATILRQLLTQPQHMKTEQDRQQQQQQQQQQPQQHQQQPQQQQPQQQQQSTSDLKLILLNENGFPPEKCTLNAAGFD